MPAHAISHHFMSCQLIPQHAMLYYVRSYQVRSYHAIPYHIISCHITAYHTISYYIISRHTILYHVMPYYLISHYLIPGHIIPCHTMPCHNIHCFALSLSRRTRACANDTVEAATPAASHSTPASLVHTMRVAHTHCWWMTASEPEASGRGCGGGGGGDWGSSLPTHRHAPPTQPRGYGLGIAPRSHLA